MAVPSASSPFSSPAVNRTSTARPSPVFDALSTPSGRNAPTDQRSGGGGFFDPWNQMSSRERAQVLFDFLQGMGGVQSGPIVPISSGSGNRVAVGGQAPALGFAELLSRIASSGRSGRNA